MMRNTLRDTPPGETHQEEDCLFATIVHDSALNCFVQRY